MNYEKPRQVDPKSDRPDAGKWRWTLYNDSVGTYATGGCDDGCPGHDTADEAAEHHRQWKISRVRWVVVPDSEARQLNRCRVEGCGTFTASRMTLEGGGYFLEIVCPAHHTAEVAEQLIGDIGEEWHS